MEPMAVDHVVSHLDRLPVELRDKIMASADLGSLMTLGKTSKVWGCIANDWAYRRVVELLRFFQLNPQHFLSFLTDTKSVISGSAALLVFCPGLFVPGDLDIYCSEDKLHEVMEYFNTHTEYHEPEEKPKGEELAKDSDYEAWVFSENHLAKVLKLSCSPPLSSGNMDPRLVNIIAVRKIHTVSSISHFHSTPVMNFITGTGAVCVYPELTLTMRGIINTERQSNASTEKFTKCLNKYRSRGFDMAMTLGKWPGMRHDFARAKLLKDMPICAVAFPKGTMSKEKPPKEDAMEEELWNLNWELSEWAFE